MSAMQQRVAALPSIEALSVYKTMAQKIRACRAAQEVEDRGAIAKHLGIRYQWVRNVLLQEVKEPTPTVTTIEVDPISGIPFDQD